MNRVIGIPCALICALSASWCYSMQLFDNPHFFRANHFFGEPRLEKKALTSLDIYVFDGKTTISRNAYGKHTNLLDLYGPAKMLYLGSNVPDKDPNNPADLALINLGAMAPCGQFAQLSFGGKLNELDCIILATQNIAHGFFLQLHAPFRKIDIRGINHCELAPADDACQDNQTEVWNNFLLSFNDILQRYNLSLRNVHEHGIGDVSVYAGWTINYQDTKRLDYIDTAIKLGLITPTGRNRDENAVFSIPLGYNGHYGISPVCDLSIGAYGWLTVGAHVRGIFFNSKDQTIRMKTDVRQQGFLKLAQGKARVSPGAIAEAGLYGKADHLIRGLSIIIGYSYDYQARTHLAAQNNYVFPVAVINTDAMYGSWDMHTIHYALEYDFTKEHHVVGPRLSFYFDQQAGGSKVFNADMTGAGIGIDIAWN